MKIANWGNYPVVKANVHEPVNQDEVSLPDDILIARGLGRCYGDASLSKNMLSTLQLNKFISFNREEGIIECEAGVSFDDILKVIIPAGWFLPVTPGTKFITLGGAIAADVHGKNHHVDGTFCKHLLEMKVLLADGSITTCSTNSELFQATSGGMGLTGIILSATFRLKKIHSSFITRKTYKARNLDEIFHCFEETTQYTYTVAWIDCLATGKKLGRSVLYAGEHSDPVELPDKYRNNPFMLHAEPGISVPVYLPSFTLNNITVKAFNYLYYAKQKNRGKEIVHYDPFFYPLDKVGNWNRIYGRQGFVQYQFVLPKENSMRGLVEILNRVASNGRSSFLAVLKLFGKQDDLLSFPMEGYTLALDFPVTASILKFLDELDAIVKDMGGRVYLAKDARMKAAVFGHTYHQLQQFKELRYKFDPGKKFSSLLSQRLEI